MSTYINAAYTWNRSHIYGGGADHVVLLIEWEVASFKPTKSHLNSKPLNVQYYPFNGGTKVAKVKELRNNLLKKYI
ncbi:hypothetical protein [Paenibacillus crassostreae]|uniref:Uncharacterized protein n=1 Tax=Paenibacillus crassostreae TaxID=1763538 RepID=A0A167GR10_9BACL|nr:hypothetical protein [Paenibacillus crassostreae]AOZ92017.1 hypothetical protein LPB68_07135 [Paenibacillus crassostreae]OAB77825.1 hypothetical protein PNBC_00215 [Paenibacillus crassostreae]